MSQKTDYKVYLVVGAVVFFLMATGVFLAFRVVKNPFAFKFLQTTLTTDFRQSISKISATNGDILEVATLESTEILTRSDTKTLFDNMISLGTTVSEIQVPAVYRYHIKLSEDWVLNANPQGCDVVAPVLRPSLPPAIRTEGMRKRTEDGWLRFNKNENLEVLEQNITRMLEARSVSPEMIKLVRDPARKAIAAFVRDWFLKNKNTYNFSDQQIKVTFVDEMGSRP